MIEVSSGGVVVFGNTVLLLKKYNGDWVLPKGKLEKGETFESAALREVLEEARVKAQILDYIGEINYKYKNIRKNEIIYKTVHWYLMKTNSMDCLPQKKEGFVDAKFVHMDKAKQILKYEDEQKIVKKGIDLIDQEG